MRTLLDTFPGFDRLFIGGDQLLKQLEQISNTATKAITNYPPYNVKKVDDNKYVIEMAVAGFTRQDVELEMIDGKLIIKGKMETVDDLTKDGTEQTYLYKGISDRAFTRQFALADTVEVKNAELLNGMLKVWLEAIIPEHKKPKKIDITDGETKKKSSKKEFIAE